MLSCSHQMALPYTIDGERQLVTVTLVGRIVGADIAEAIQRVYTDPAWQSGFNVVWDGTFISELLFEQDDIPNFVALQRRYAEQAGPGRDVLVINRKIDEMMARTYVDLMKDVRLTSLAKSKWEAQRTLGRV